MAYMTGQEYSLHVQCVGMNAGNDSNDRTGERSLHAVCVCEGGRKNANWQCQSIYPNSTFYHHFRFFQICLNKLITVYLCHVLNITYKLNYFQTLSLIQSTLSFRSHLFLIFVIHLNQSNHQGWNTCAGMRGGEGVVMCRMHALCVRAHFDIMHVCSPCHPSPHHASRDAVGPPGYRYFVADPPFVGVSEIYGRIHRKVSYTSCLCSYLHSHLSIELVYYVKFMGTFSVWRRLKKNHSSTKVFDGDRKLINAFLRYGQNVC